MYSLPEPGHPRAVAVLGAEGRIGGLLMGMTRGPWCPVAVTRMRDAAGLGLHGEPVPIVVCTRNDALGAVLERVHTSRYSDLVFVQNGYLDPWLDQHGLHGCTRGVLFVAVARRGDAPIPGGASVFTGPWARVVAGMLNHHGVHAQAVAPRVYRSEEAVKLAWTCIFGLLGSATGLTVGEVAEQHEADVRALYAEMHPLFRLRFGQRLGTAEVTARMLAYSEYIAHFPSGLKEWPWRNGALVRCARELDHPLPLHATWLARAGGVPGG